LGSLICYGRKAKAALLGPLYRELWQGEVEAAIAWLEAYRAQARNLERLDELIQYLRYRQPYIPNYRQRRRDRQYIGSGHAEKANDLIVARRQRGTGLWTPVTLWQRCTRSCLMGDGIGIGAIDRRSLWSQLNPELIRANNVLRPNRC